MYHFSGKPLLPNALVKNIFLLNNGRQIEKNIYLNDQQDASANIL